MPFVVVEDPASHLALVAQHTYKLSFLRIREWHRGLGEFIRFASAAQLGLSAVTKHGDVDRPWKRWWVPVDSDMADTTGFLDDPDGPYAEYFDWDTTTLADLQEVPCLVLLGEAGMGKTTELEIEDARVGAAGIPTVHVDLGDEPDLATLRCTLYDNPAFDAWLNGTDQLTLFLDSFDEAMITIDKLVGGLTRLLDEIPVDRLNLRIASRSSVWSNLLDRALAARFADVQRLTLCPLTQNNAADAARNGGLDANRFLSEVATRDLGVLAARPLTLRMLVALGSTGPLPAGRAQLYRESTTLLARENSERRQEERTTDLPVRQRLALVRRLASLSVLTGHPTIRPRRTVGSPGTEIAIDDLASDASQLKQFDEVLQSGLFTAASGGSVRFAHRSIAEFLTGETLAEMPLAAVTHLLVDPLHPGHVVPQLAGVAVWAASLDDRLYKWLVDTEPELLLTANLADAREEQRRILGRAILGDLSGAVPPRRRRYWWLAYDGLAGDVAPYLADDKPSWVKVEAAHVLSDAGCHDLDERLVDMIEDIAQRHPADYLGADTRLAISLIYALHATQRTDLLNRLAAVADQDDAPDQLRAEILGELWGRVSATTLLPIVTRLGAFAGTSPIASTVADQLATAIEHELVELDVLLDWIDSTGLSAVGQEGAPAGEFHVDWHAVVAATALHASESDTSLTEPQRAVIARAMFGWHSATHEFLPLAGTRRRELTAEGRHMLATIMLPHLPDRAAAYHLAQARLVTVDDLEWLMRRWGPTAGDTDKSRNVRAVVEMLVDPIDSEQEQLARSIATDFPDLAPAIDDLFDPRRAAAAAAERATALKQAQAEAARTAAHQFDPSALIAAVQAGDWPTVARQLRSTVGTRQYAVGAKPTDAPAWAQLDTATKMYVVDCAITYLQATPSSVSADHADDLGFAYTLVHTERPAAVRSLDKDIVLAWLDTVRRRPAQHRTVEAMLTNLAAVGSQQLDAIVVQAIGEDGTQAYPWQTTMLGDYTSPAVEDALYDLATDSDTRGPVVQAALDALLARNTTRGVRAAHHVIVRRPAEPPHGTLFRSAWRRAVHACAALVNSSAAADQFERVLDLLGRSPDFAVDVIAQAGERTRAGMSWPGLDSDQLATLFLWARRTLPEEPEYRPGVVVPGNYVHEFANNLFNRLAARDDAAAIAAIERIAVELDASWPRRSAADIARRLREKDWAPPSLRIVDAILADPSRRAVTSEPQLARVLLDVIDEIAEEIARDPDVAALFWNKQPGQNPTWRPVDEPTFTTRFVDRIRARLDTIIVRQEGQLNLRIGSIPGSFPDLEAITVHDGVQLSVAGEVKGNWNREVLTAIGTQLADRYVTGTRTFTGIYVVAYFASDRWDPADRRRADARGHSREQLQEALEANARALSVNGKIIHFRVIPIEI